jgi:predicted Zn-dependent peptidase
MTIFEQGLKALGAGAVGFVAAATGAAAQDFTVPVDYHTLDNGLKVVLSEDDTVPTTTIAVYYGIGFRIEPRDRTGFAHLFEHMMFQGTPNFPKGGLDDIINNNGGVNNGSTRFDFTNYYEIVPAHMTKPLLWVEADRMRAVALDQAALDNQIGVVSNEVKVNVLNQPYGGFPWLDMPQLANENWYNTHNFYGDLSDLEAAKLDDVEAFFDAYYAPNNAVLVVAGDIEPEETLSWIEEYFGGIEASDDLQFPDISEPRQEEEKRQVKYDPLAPQPALAFGYHVPEKNTPDWHAMVLLDQILLQGADSRLAQKLVQEEAYAGAVYGGINWPLGNIFNYDGPMIWTAFLIHSGDVEPSTIMGDVNAVVSNLQEEPVTQEELDRALIKLRSDIYDSLGDGNRIALVDMLATLALFEDNPERVNSLLEPFEKVTPEMIQKVANEYLRQTNRSVIELRPGEAPADDTATSEGE